MSIKKLHYGTVPCSPTVRCTLTTTHYSTFIIRLLLSGFALCYLLFTFFSCSKMGYGILLWSTDEPPIQSGTILPVYIRSNIEQVWVVGIPKELKKDKNDSEKTEIPLSQFELVGSKRKTLARADEFSEFAPLYGENLQDGLPIRERPDNVSRRVYRLRTGEIVKVLGKARGSPPVGTTGEPLPGDWYKVLTQEGVTGYCFSYRLRVFDQNEGPIQAAVAVRENIPDPDLDLVLSKTWSPESYLQMINSRRVNISELEKRYRFDPGQDTGIAKITLPDLEREFIYDGIICEEERVWRFEGADLQMNLRNNSTLVVQFTEGAGLRRTIVFVSLAASIDDLIFQENARRENQFLEIYSQGPVFTSNNFGTITFTQTGTFTWTGFGLLVPQLIPSGTNGDGRIIIDLFIVQSFTDRYDGAFTLRFSDRQNTTLRFMYSMDNQGMRLEVLPDYAVEDVTVTRRSSSPMVLYFFVDSSY